MVPCPATCGCGLYPHWRATAVLHYSVTHPTTLDTRALHAGLQDAAVFNRFSTPKWPARRKATARATIVQSVLKPRVLDLERALGMPDKRARCARPARRTRACPAAPLRQQRPPGRVRGVLSPAVGATASMVKLL